MVVITTDKGILFETGYRAGVEGPDYQSSGLMRQKGTKYWADRGKTWTWMMDYYYSDSNYNLPIGTIQRNTW